MTQLSYNRHRYVFADYRYSPFREEPMTYEIIYVVPSQDVIELDDQITEWANRTFPREATDIRPIIAHMKRELDELYQALAADDFAHAMEEAADVRFLLTHLVGRLGGNLGQETMRKFDINQRRDWGDPDEEGVVEHV
jgi:NTP pyrophosphatase (non-canonical NTP hydrolase)